MNIIYGLLLVLIMAMPLTANACRCDVHPEEHLFESNLIFKGKVLSIEPEIASDGKPTGNNLANFKILVSYKGAMLKTVKIKYLEGDGRGCFSWKFTQGKETTVFASGNLHEGFETDACMMIPHILANTESQSVIENYRAKRAALLKPPVTVKRLREQVAFFIKYHDYDDAEAVFNKLLTKQPKDIDALIGRADIRYELKRYAQALADYHSVLNLKANHQAARHGKTLSLLKLERMNELEPQDKDFSGYLQDYKQNDKLSFAGLDLTGANFSHSYISSDFSGANLSNADFSEASIGGCNFTNAKLSQAKFYKGRLGSVRFDNAVLDNADFSNANMERAFFDKVSSMQGTKFIGTRFVEAKLKGMKFDGHDFSNADFRGADLRDTRFSNSLLNGATFGTLVNSTDLKGADLSSANLTGLKWEGLIVIDCRTKFPKDYDLTLISFISSWSGCEGTAPKSNLANSVRWIEKIDAPNSNFSDLNISGVEFLSGHFDGSNFSNATLKQIMFGNGSYQNTNFENAKLNNVRFYNVNFSGASFAHAVLSEATLDNVDFSNANFDDVVMTDVVFDEKTKFPEGFDPLAAGAKKKVKN